ELAQLAAEYCLLERRPVDTGSCQLHVRVRNGAQGSRISHYPSCLCFGDPRVAECQFGIVCGADRTAEGLQAGGCFRPDLGYVLRIASTARRNRICDFLQPCDAIEELLDGIRSEVPGTSQSLSITDAKVVCPAGRPRAVKSIAE